MDGNLLALDVGFAKMGWCVFDNGEPIAFGIIKTAKSGKKNVRVADDRAYMAGYLAAELKRVICDHKVCGCVGELPSGGAKSAKAMAYMAAGIAVASSVLSVLKIPVEWTTPTEGKMALCGKRNASKVEMMDAVRKEYPHILWPKVKAKFEDVADAVGAYRAAKDGTLVRLFGASTQKST
jgi:Holliday junction resolvasome RuvABC endonuclease subunit